jgi:hypothetical protein
MFDLDLRVRTEVLMARRSLWFVPKAQASAENIMKLVRFDGGKTGLMVELRSGPHVIDVIGSLGALAPDDPISQGILNGILKDKGSWAPLIEHWEQARTGLRRLAALAAANPDRPHLVICRADEARLALPPGSPRGIVTLDIAESNDVVQDPTGREAMARQIGSPPCAEMQAPSIIPFRDKKRSVETLLPLEDS